MRLILEVLGLICIYAPFFVVGIALATLSKTIGCDTGVGFFLAGSWAGLLGRDFSIAYKKRSSA